MARYQVTCIIKPERDNTHEASTYLGSAFGYWPVQMVIDAIQNNVHSFYTDDGRRQPVVKVRERSGKKFVQSCTKWQIRDPRPSTLMLRDVS